MDVRSVDVGKCLSRGERRIAAMVIVINLSLIGWLSAGTEFDGLLDGTGDQAPASTVKAGSSEPWIEIRPMALDSNGDQAVARAFPSPRR